MAMRLPMKEEVLVLVLGLATMVGAAAAEVHAIAAIGSAMGSGIEIHGWGEMGRARMMRCDREERAARRTGLGGLSRGALSGVQATGIGLHVLVH